MPWSREIDPNWTPNLFRLGDDKASYTVRIRHILPTPIPNGVKQFWQVVDCSVLIIDRDCKVKVETFHIIDIVDIGGRAKIGDKLAFGRDGDNCLVVELCTHTVGFDDQASTFAQQTNVKATKKLADKIKAKMGQPKETFTTSYLFNVEDCCQDLKSFLFFGLPLPSGERLAIEGIGVFDKDIERTLDDGTTGDEQAFLDEAPRLEDVSSADLERFHVALSLSADEAGMHARYLGGLPTSIGPGLRPFARPGRWLIELAEPGNDDDGLRVQAPPVVEVTIPDSGPVVEGELAIELGDRIMLLRPVTPGGKDVQEVLAQFGDRAITLPDRLRARLDRG